MNQLAVVNFRFPSQYQKTMPIPSFTIKKFYSIVFVQAFQFSNTVLRDVLKVGV